MRFPRTSTSGSSSRPIVAKEKEFLSLMTSRRFPSMSLVLSQGISTTHCSLMGLSLISGSMFWSQAWTHGVSTSSMRAWSGLPVKNTTPRISSPTSLLISQIIPSTRKVISLSKTKTQMLETKVISGVLPLSTSTWSKWVLTMIFFGQRFMMSFSRVS